MSGPTSKATATGRLTAPVLMLLLAGLALVLGLLVYLADRRASGAMLLPRAAALGTGPLFAAAGAWLPSFIHPFAVSLLSAAALPRRDGPAYGAVVAWWAVDLTFELGQLPQFSTPIAQALQASLGSHEPAQALSRFLLYGRFDPADVMALTAGAMAAAGVLRQLYRWENRYEP